MLSRNLKLNSSSKFTKPSDISHRRNEEPNFPNHEDFLENWIYCELLLTPNRPLVHTSFTYPKLNMDGFSLLNGSLGYVDSTQEVEWNSLHAERGIGKEGKIATIHATFIKRTFLSNSSTATIAQSA